MPERSTTCIATALIAIIDDDRSLRIALSALCRSAGFRVWDGASAEAFASAQWPGDCLITDLHLPGQDGLALLRELRAAGDRRPAILISARIHAELQTRCAAVTDCTLLPKPFDGCVLLEHLKRLTRRDP